MFYKLLDVFVSSLIFILGLALIYVLLNYATSKILYSVIIPTGYPLNQEYQKELYHRDYNVLYMKNSMPYQDSDGFKISGTTDWVPKASYFAISNYKENKETNSLLLQGYPGQALESSGSPIFGDLYTNYNVGAPFTIYSNELYQYAEYYPMFADPDTSGYYMALFNPTLAPYEREYNTDLSKFLLRNNIASKYTVFMNGKEYDPELMMLILGGLKYAYAPIPIIGYSSSDVLYTPSLYIMSGMYDNKQLTLKVVSMEREEIIGGSDRKLTLYLWYDKENREWKPLVFGSPDFKDTVMVLPTTYNTFYTVSVLVNPVQIEYKVLPETIISFGYYDKEIKNKFVGVFDVVGNPVYSVNNNGDLVLLGNNTLYEIQVYSYTHTGDDAITYKTVVKDYSYFTKYDEWFDRLNNLNIH